jgi:hypothetical protein
MRKRREMMRKIDRNSPEYHFLRQLIANIKCVVCSQKYGDNDVFILGQQEDVWMLLISCPHCQTQGIILAMVKEEENVEIVTDLTPEELERIAGRPAIDIDDVLDVHRFLRDFDGDFRELFKEDLSRT